MTDIYISYAREDRERVRPIVESLQFEGWDVWWDPSEPTIGGSAALDQKLGSAGAILVVWSGYSRGSEYVRSEAATGLYKNKLIQVRVDSSVPPRPFDQVEVVDLSRWQGERDDGNWRQTISAIRLFAGAPQIPQQIPAFQTKQKKPKPAKAPKPAPPPPPRPSPMMMDTAPPPPLPLPPLEPPRASKPARSSQAYLERDRWIAPGPVVVVALALATAGGVWYFDPFGIRGPGMFQQAAKEEAPAEPAAAPEPAAADVIPASFEDTPASDKAWDAVDRADPISLRDYMTAHPKSSNAETARSLIRVIDAQAWVEAVTNDNEKGYQAYLAKFPAKGVGAGAMTAAAEDRLTSLAVERKQAIEEIQRGLTALNLYSGAIDGKAANTTTKAVSTFAANNRRRAPALATAAPRELRQFAALIVTAASDAGKAPAPAADPIIATATTTAPVAPSAAAADAADRERRAAAAAAAAAAAENADELANVAIKREADLNGFKEAERVNTVASYQAYIRANPTGAKLNEARAAIALLSRPVPAAPAAAPFSLDLVSAEIRVAAEAARRAQTTAITRATTARSTSEAAATAPGLRSIAAADGSRFETQIANGAPNGLGSRSSGGGDRYRGEIRDGQPAGLGVFEYGPGSASDRSGIERYEGEIAANAVTGYGMTYMKNGDVIASLKAGDAGAQRGVISSTNGQRYEGELRNGVREGFGVVWSSDGKVVQAGRWDNNQLVSPMIAPLPPAAPAPAAAPINLAPRN